MILQQAPRQGHQLFVCVGTPGTRGTIDWQWHEIVEIVAVVRDRLGFVGHEQAVLVRLKGEQRETALSALYPVYVDDHPQEIVYPSPDWERYYTQLGKRQI